MVILFNIKTYFSQRTLFMFFWSWNFFVALDNFFYNVLKNFFKNSFCCCWIKSVRFLNLKVLEWLVFAQTTFLAIGSTSAPFSNSLALSLSFSNSLSLDLFLSLSMKSHTSNNQEQAFDNFKIKSRKEDLEITVFIFFLARRWLITFFLPLSFSLPLSLRLSLSLSNFKLSLSAPSFNGFSQHFDGNISTGISLVFMNVQPPSFRCFCGRFVSKPVEEEEKNEFMDGCEEKLLWEIWTMFEKWKKIRWGFTLHLRSMKRRLEPTHPGQTCASGRNEQRSKLSELPFWCSAYSHFYSIGTNDAGELTL